MAQQINCDGPDGGPAAFLVTMIEEAETKGFCLGCMADFAQAYLQAVDPARLAPPPAKTPRKSRAKAPAPVAHDSQGGDSDDSAQEQPAGQAAG